MLTVLPWLPKEVQSGALRTESAAVDRKKGTLIQGDLKYADLPDYVLC